MCNVLSAPEKAGVRGEGGEAAAGLVSAPGRLWEARAAWEEAAHSAGERAGVSPRAAGTRLHFGLVQHQGIH